MTEQPTPEPLVEPDNPAAYALASHIADHPISTVQAAFRYLNTPLTLEARKDQAPIADELARAVTRAKQAKAERDRVQQAACRTAENLRRAEQRAEQAEDAIERVRKLAERWDNALAPDKRYARTLSDALDQPQQPTEDEARQLPCSLWLLSNGHAPHWWQPQPGMADVLCPGAPRKAVATQPQQPTTTEA